MNLALLPGDLVRLNPMYRASVWNDLNQLIGEFTSEHTAIVICTRSCDEDVLALTSSGLLGYIPVNNLERVSL